MFQVISSTTSIATVVGVLVCEHRSQENDHKSSEIKVSLLLFKKHFFSIASNLLFTNSFFL
ncbi:hypothetical protein HOG21_04035 [bacterium]|nr:hypothetical protein [bacterium]